MEPVSLAPPFLLTMADDDDVSVEVTKYSVFVGFALITVFVLPCVMFALLSKFFQRPDPERRSVRSSLYVYACICTVEPLYKDTPEMRTSTLMRTLSVVPRVSGIERFHCMCNFPISIGH